MADKRTPWPFGGPATEPSPFAKDPAFAARKGGKSQSQIASETVARRTSANGVNPGKLYGLSRAERQHAGGRTVYLLNKTGVQ